MALCGGLDAGVEAHEEAEKVRDYGVGEKGEVAVVAGWGVTFCAGSFPLLGVLLGEGLCVRDVVIGAFSFRWLQRHWG